MTKLRIADNLALPLDAVTQTFGVLAKRGVGKTYTAAVFVEELLKADRQVVVIDPIGVWFGLRSSADGKRAGLPIVVMGGDHGDVPLEVTAGSTIAEFITEQKASVVLDLSRFRKGEQVRFMTDFAETLYHKNRDPLMLVVDEADAFAPQRPQKGEERLLGAMEDLVRRGRARGLGVMLVTQRAAVLNKNVLTQVEVLVVLRTIAPQDRDAIDAWVKVYGTEKQRDTLMGSLASLGIGEAWFWSPGWLDTFTRVQVRRRETFDSSATPKQGETRKAPKKLADVDLEALKGRISATIEKAKLEDPKLLRGEISRLNEQVKRLNGELEKVSRKQQEVSGKHSAPLTDADRELLKKLRRMLEAMAGELGGRSGAFLAGLETRLEQVIAAVMQRFHTEGEEIHELGRKQFYKIIDGKGFQKIIAKLSDASPESKAQRSRPQVQSRPAHAVASSQAVSPRRTPSQPSDENGALTGPEQRILDAIAWLEQIGVETPEQPAVAFLAGYTYDGGAFNNPRGRLRQRGFVEYLPGDRIQLTDAGRALANMQEESLSTDELHRRVLERLPGPEQRILRPLLDAYPKALPDERLAELAGYTAGAGAFNNPKGRLRSLGLIEYPQPRHAIARSLLFVH